MLRVVYRAKLVALDLDRKYGRRLGHKCAALMGMAHVSRDLEDGGAYAKRALELMNLARDAKTLEEAEAALDLTAALAPFDGVIMKAKAGLTEGFTGATAADLERSALGAGNDLSSVGAGKEVCVHVAWVRRL